MLKNHMAIKPIIRMGNPILRQENSPITLSEIHSTEFKELLADMQDTMNEQGGIGIAAPQIGVNKQVAMIELSEDNPRYPGQNNSELIIFINPRITVLSDELQGHWEGCLSVPGLRGFVERPNEIRVDFIDELGTEKTLKVSDFLATVFQHEIDHLFGILYVDKIKDPRLFAYNEEFDQFVAHSD